MKEYFEQWGELVSYDVARNPKTNKSRGFGFIIYTTEEMLDDARNNRPHKIDGRQVFTKRACPQHKFSIKRLFVHGMYEGIAKEDLQEVFSRFGKIEMLEMIRDKNTGKLKNSCYITFEDFDSVDKCVLRQQISVGGKYVRVQKAIPRRDGMEGGRESRDGGMRGRGDLCAGYNNSLGCQRNPCYPGNMGGGSGPQGYKGVGNRCGSSDDMVVRSNSYGKLDLCRNPSLRKDVQAELLMGLESITHLLKVIQICVDADSEGRSPSTDRTQRNINSI